MSFLTSNMGTNKTNCFNVNFTLLCTSEWNNIQWKEKKGVGLEFIHRDLT